jgi:hypothetical protein
MRRVWGIREAQVADRTSYRLVLNLIESSVDGKEHLQDKELPSIMCHVHI